MNITVFKHKIREFLQKIIKYAKLCKKNFAFGVNYR
jgi:uncharacterized protein YaaR (DUF327 family)